MPYSGPLEDRVAIRELLERYADAVCCNDPDAWGSTWAEDGVWELPDYPAVGTVTGRKQIVEMWNAAMAGYPGILFIATPGSIEISGDSAQVRSYTSEVYDDKDGVARRDRGRYEDVVVKRGGQWLFLKRTFRKLHHA